MTLITTFEVGDFAFSQCGDNEAILEGFSMQGKEKLYKCEEDPDLTVSFAIPQVDYSGKKVVAIGREAFMAAYGIEEITDWANVEVIHGGAFRDTMLKTIPGDWGNVNTIHCDTFALCDLTRIPDDWKNMGYVGVGAFMDNDIQDAPYTWRDDELVIEASAFQFNKKLEHRFRSENGVLVPKSDFDNAPYILEGLEDFTFSKEKSEVILSGLSRKALREIGDLLPDKEVHLRIPAVDYNGNEVTRIAPYAFSEQKRITRILESWENVVEIGDRAFEGAGIEGVPPTWSKVKVIGERAFEYCRIIKLPDSWRPLEEIGHRAFCNMFTLESFPILKDAPLLVGGSAFDNSAKPYVLQDIPEEWRL